jgi:hypothetical protein
VIRLASGDGATTAGGALGRSKRQLAARLLISASDTTPMFAVLAVGLASGVASGLFVRRLGKKMR